MKVVILKSVIESSSWNDGLFAVQKVENGVIYLWKIIDGKLATYEDVDNTPRITCVGTSYKGIIETDLTINDNG